MKQVKRRRLGADVWRGLVTKFADSGVSVRAFCAHEGISTSTFNWWRWRLAGSSGADPSSERSATMAAGEFVDLGTLPTPTSQPQRFELRLDLGGGLVLHLVRG
jgi:putative transposase